VGVDHFMYQTWDVLNPAVTGYINVLNLPTRPLPVSPGVFSGVFDAREDLLVTSPNVPTSITFAGLVGNDFDPEGQAISLTSSGIDKTGLVGSMPCTATGCTFTSSNGFNGRTRFRYTATDSQGNKDTATVWIKVGAVANGVPVVQAATRNFTVDYVAGLQPQNTVTFSVFELLTKVYDPDNDPLSVIVYPVYPAQNRKGTMTCSPGSSPYVCTFTPTTTGVETISFGVGDGSGAPMTMGTFTITIN
jgi:hypothetical protein